MKENEQNIRQIDSERFESLPLWEINAATESKANIRKTETTLFAEGLRENNSPWLSTIELLNDRFYTRKTRARNENYAVKAVMKWTSSIEKEVDRLVTKGTIQENDRDYTLERLEQYASNKINKELAEVQSTKLENWRDNGAGRLLTNALSEETKFRPTKRNSTSVRRFVEHESDLILKQKPEVEEKTLPPEEPLTEERITEHNEISFPKSRNVLKAVGISAGITAGLGLIYLASQQSEDRKLNLPQPTTTPEPEVSPSLVRIAPLATRSPNSYSALDPLTTADTVVTVIPQTTPVPTKNESPSQKAITPNAESQSAKEISINTTPEPDYYHVGIDFANGRETIIGINSVSISTTPVVLLDSFSPKELKEYNIITASGTDNSVVSIDIYGNTIWRTHSGTNHGEGNPGEALRKKIQGGGINDTATYLSEEEVQDNVEKLIGQTVFIKQKDGSTRTFKVIASGIIPNGELNDKYSNDAKASTDTAIEATGGENSEFNTFTKERGVIFSICLHNAIPDPGNSENVLVDYKYETLVLGLLPTEDATLQNNVETARLKEKENYTPLEKSARILAQIINSASSRVKDYGEKFKNYTLAQLKLFNIPVSREISEVVGDVANETSDGSKIQCTSGADLLGSMPGSEGVIMDTYGWVDKNKDRVQRNYNQAGDFITNIDGAIDQTLLNGGEINKYGANIDKIDSFSQVKVGDKIYIPKSPLLPDGHVVVVIDSWIDNSGKTHLQIFDVNYNNFGLARILEDVTADNIYELIAKGQKLPLYSIRPQEKSNQLASNTN